MNQQDNFYTPKNNIFIRVRINTHETCETSQQNKICPIYFEDDNKWVICKPIMEIGTKYNSTLFGHKYNSVLSDA